MPEYVNTKQACEFLGLKEVNTLYEYINSGKLKAYKLGGDSKRRRWRISRADLEEFVITSGEPERKAKVGKR